MSFMITWENVAGTIAVVGFIFTLREAVKALLNSDISSSDDALTLGWLGEPCRKDPGLSRASWTLVSASQAEIKRPHEPSPSSLISPADSARPGWMTMAWTNGNLH